MTGGLEVRKRHRRRGEPRTSSAAEEELLSWATMIMELSSRAPLGAPNIHPLSMPATEIQHKLPNDVNKEDVRGLIKLTRSASPIKGLNPKAGPTTNHTLSHTQTDTQGKSETCLEKNPIRTQPNPPEPGINATKSETGTPKMAQTAQSAAKACTGVHSAILWRGVSDTHLWILP